MTGNQTIFDYLEVLSSKAPVPGGGGASAVAGGLATALGQMVINLTIGKKKYADVEETMQAHLVKLKETQDLLLQLADEDAKVFEPLAKAYSLPAGEEKDQLMETLLLDASLVPIKIMESSMSVMALLEDLEQKGSVMAVSDVGVGVQMARTALTGAVMNVWINTKSMKNREKAEEINQKADEMLQAGIQKADEIYGKVAARLMYSRNL